MESNCLANLGGINLTTRLVHENKGYHVWFVCLFIYTKHYIRFTQKKKKKKQYIRILALRLWVHKGNLYILIAKA